MSIKSWRYGLAAAVLVAFGLLSLASGSVPWVQGQPDCTVTVQPGQSIQQAIDEAKEGAVICLAAGTWGENIKIRKSVTLRGAGREQTKIKSKQESQFVMEIKSDAEIKVRIEGLNVTGSALWGLEIRGLTQVVITNSQFLYNGVTSIRLWDRARLTVVGSHLSFSAIAIIIGASSRAIITNSQISSSWFAGIIISDSAQATITSSQISGNGLSLFTVKGGSGILINDSAQVTITDSQISGNGGDGIGAGGSTQMEIRGSTIEGNGARADCSKKENPYVCNGITLGAESQVKIIDSMIRNNADWGVAAALNQCGYGASNFTGKVVFEDMMLNQIAGNNTSGNQNGMGNPGNHYWNRADIPDGQVCLP